MGTEPKKPAYYLINTEDKEELIYIAEKLGCKVSDIHYAIETLKTHKRSVIYSWIVDQTFKGQL